MAASNSGIRLLVGTRKGAFFLDADENRKSWKLTGPIFLGHIIYHLEADPRAKGKMVMAAKTGHLGPTIYHSKDNGKTFVESEKPPQFPKQDGDEKGRSVDHTFWLSPGHATEPGVWYAGTSPPGLFRSEDDGATWEPVSGFNEHPLYETLTKDGATPGGQLLHSVLIDPRDKNHMYLSISVGGTFESTDQGKNWSPMNKGVAADFLPDPSAEYGHDPHCMVMHPAKPDRLYQQNHCGIYRMDRPEKEWVRIGKNMPSEIGDIGFPIVIDPKNADRAWVFPMDGTTVWPRTSPDGKPAVYMTTDAGSSWKRLDKGLPGEHGYFTVKRQSMTSDSQEKLGLYFGTTGGDIWGSVDEGQSWTCLIRYLPEIYSLRAMPIGG